ncbi:MAG: hypothetical protein HY743_12910 [Deltaproteobacteria bacterium]|nr:hypothetical protein [Deltaproteobacteria bacterium]
MRLLLGQCQIEGGNATRQYYYYLPVLLFFALSGSQLLFSKQLGPPILNSLVLTLSLAAFLAYQARPGVGRACLFGLSISLALTAHLSTIPFVGALLIVVGISFFLENRDQPWKNKLVQAGVAGVSILVVPLVAQVITWMPTLWIKDPFAWKFTAYFGRPYDSYFDQLWWYARQVDSHIDYSYPVYRRFIQFGIYPLFMEGPVFFLAALGWILVLGQIWRQGWTSCRGVLLLGPTIPVFWYTFQKSLFPKIEAVAPLGIYFSLLAGYAVWYLYAQVKSSNQALKKGVILVILVMIVTLQVIHALPIIKHQGGFLRLRAWFDKHGEDRVICLVRQGLGEAAGLNTWGYEGSRGNLKELGAWGMRPALSWKDDRLPQLVSATELYYLADHEKSFLKFKGIDIKKPLVHFPDFPNQYYYATKYLTYLAKLFLPLNRSWSRKIETEVERIRIWHYETGIFIYQITKNDYSLNSADRGKCPKAMATPLFPSPLRGEGREGVASFTLAAHSRHPPPNPLPSREGELQRSLSQVSRGFLHSTAPLGALEIGAKAIID